MIIRKMERRKEKKDKYCKCRHQQEWVTTLFYFNFLSEQHCFTSTSCLSSSLLPSSFIIFYLSSTPYEYHGSKALVFLTVLYVSSYRWVHFSRAVLFIHQYSSISHQPTTTWIHTDNYFVLMYCVCMIAYHNLLLSISWDLFNTALSVSWDLFNTVLSVSWDWFNTVQSVLWESFNTAFSVSWDLFNTVLSVSWDLFNTVLSVSWDLFNTVLSVSWDVFNTVLSASWYLFNTRKGYV